MLRIYVPAELGCELIDHGSGIVSATSDENIGILRVHDRVHIDHVIVYFEGNRYGAMNLRRWVDRVSCAADRLLTKYPTVAVACLDRTTLLEVGTLDPTAGVATLHDEQCREIVARWAGEDVKVEEYTLRALRDRKIEDSALLASGGNPVLARRLRKGVRRS
jgi:hypothetical protein